MGGPPDCTQSTIPLSGNEDGFIDYYLLGEWQALDEAEDSKEGEIKLVAIGEQPVFRVEMYGQSHIRVTWEDKEFVGYSTLLDGNKYLNLRLVRCDGCDERTQAQLENTSCGYQVLKYLTYFPADMVRKHVSDDPERLAELESIAIATQSIVGRMLLISMMSDYFVSDEIEQGRIPGTVDCEDCFWSGACLSASGEELRKYVLDRNLELYHSSSDAGAYIRIQRPHVAAEEPIDELMLGTWHATGQSETRCHSSDVSVTLRVFQKIAEGLYNAHYTERGIVLHKPECAGEYSPDEIIPFDLGGGDVQVRVTGTGIRITADDDDFHTEELELVDESLVGTDDMGPIRYQKSFPELRYEADESWLAWTAISRPLPWQQKIALDVVRELASLDPVPSAGEEPGRDELKPWRNKPINPLEHFDDMTAQEIIDSSIDDTIEFVASELRRVRTRLAACESCPAEQTQRLKDELAIRLAQQQALNEIGIRSE
jgi:hypothetical protein